MNTINLNSPQTDSQSDRQPSPTPTPTLRPGATIPPPPAPQHPQRPGMSPRPPRPQTGSNTGKQVAAAVGAAAVASGATAAAISMLDGDEAELTSAESIVDAAEDAVSGLPQQPQAEPVQPAPAPSGNHPAGPAPTPAPGNGGDVQIPEPDPASGTDPVPAAEDILDPEEDPLIVPAGDLTIEDPEDIDAIADTLIADEQIDPDDINADDIFTFNEVETVYTVDGDEEVRASFTTNGGDDLVMVDIDNDGLFDRIETPDGFYIDDASQFSLTVSDAENMAQSEGYMAVNEEETDHFDETLGDDYLDDIIEV